ncbi:MAG: hypothetical protein J2P37_28000 [Ktedonobacteraceae bacterium]|nr:hypothetical protein [Ktedonobacteraceae bacterium]
MIKQSKPSQITFPGLLKGLVPGQLQSWGLLDVIPLFLANEAGNGRSRFVSPLEHLKLVSVPTYGTLTLQNASKSGALIAPMHIGFFQPGAQNHATSRVLLFGPGETLTVKDAFCIQASQGGLLQEAQQRFIVLPLGLRKAALAARGKEGYSRLWRDIDGYNRRYGIARGGHLERFLRPYFHRLMRFRHTLELLPGQVGAAYFVAGNLVGVEVAPNVDYWQDIGPILNIYCYGAAALLAERHQLKAQRHVVDLEGLASLDDLVQRLAEDRQLQATERIDLVRALSTLPWKQPGSAAQDRPRIVNLAQGEWSGQAVREGDDLLYLSLFRDIVV